MLRTLIVLLVVSSGWTHADARDLTLAQAEQLVAQSNREVIAARRALEAAGAGIRQADVRPNPVVSYGATSISNNFTLGPGSLIQKRIDNVFRIDQVFERGEKRQLRIGVAQGLESAARGDAQDVLRQQLLAAQVAYVELQHAQARLRILTETGQLYERTLAAAQTRLKAGDLAASEVARVQVDYERARNDVRAAQADLARAQHALAFLIGAESEGAALRATDDWPAETADLPATRQEVLAQAIAKHIESRPDVLAAQARIVAADKLRDLARSQRTRDVSLGAQFERFPGSDPTNSLGFSVAIPLFTGNDYSGDIQRAEVERYAATDALEKARAVAASEILRAASDLRAAGDRVQRYETSLLAAARRSADAAEFAFQRGATSVLEALDARRTLRAVQLEAQAARADYARALYAFRANIQPADALPAAPLR